MDAPPKRPDVEGTAAERARQDRVVFSDHAEGKLESEGVLRPEVYEVLQRGLHVARHDEFKPEYDAWSYALQGESSMGREIRIAVSFVERDDALLVTIINLE